MSWHKTDADVRLAVLRPIAAEPGEEMHVLGELPFKMVMVDRACALLPVQAGWLAAQRIFSEPR